MAFQTGVTTGAADLLSTLFTFAAANGWTIDDAVGSDKAAMHKNDVYVSFRYDSSDTTGEQIVGVYQALGHTPAALPGAHTDDSGSGFNSSSSVSGSNLDDERNVDLGLSSSELPNTYFFFEQDASPAYIHVVVQREDGQHRHFGFGEVAKFGTWTGGEYCYGHRVIAADSNLPYSITGHCCLLDGRFRGVGSSANPEHFPTIHVEGFPGQDGSSKWAEVKAAQSGATANDTAGNPRMVVQGGYRAGPIMATFGNINVNKSSGFVNLMPISLFAYMAETDPDPDKVYYLGELPDVRGIVLDGIAPGEELTIGSETWVCFPSVEKSSLTAAGKSLYQGIAYRKETS